MHFNLITSLHLITPHYTTLHYTTLHYTTLHYTTQHHVMPRHATPHYMTPCHTTLHCTTPCYIMLHHITLLFWCWRWNIPALGVNTMTPDALGPKVATASSGMVWVVWDRQYVWMFQTSFHWLGSNQIQNMIQNGNITFIIFKAI